jgi:uncharacterized protein with PIN domain
MVIDTSALVAVLLQEPNAAHMEHASSSYDLRTAS